MLDAATYVGGLPIGAIVSGQFAGKAQFLPCDGREVLRSAYPAMTDFTEMEAFGSNTMQTRSLPSSQYWCGIDFGNGVHIAVNRSTSTVCAKSTDGGDTWAAKTLPSGIYYCVKYFPTLNGGSGMWIAAGSSVCATSTDNGETWASRTLSGPVGSLEMINGLVVGLPPGQFDATDRSGYFTTPDGITWTSRTLPSSGVYTAAKLVGGRLYAPVNVASAAYVGFAYTTSDGLNWLSVSSPTTAASGTFSLEEYKGRLFWQTSNGLYVTQGNGSQMVAGATSLNRGWDGAGSGINLSSQFYGRAGSWLCEYSSGGLLSVTNDGQSWRPLASLGTLALSGLNPAGLISFGNNKLVLLTGSNPSASVYNLATDTAKFRLPKVRTYSETDRPYMKVA